MPETTQKKIKKSKQEQDQTVQCNFKVDDMVNEAFREVVFRTKGMRKGAMQESFVEAITMWIEAKKKEMKNEK